VLIKQIAVGCVP